MGNLTPKPIKKDINKKLTSKVENENSAITLNEELDVKKNK